MTEDPIHTGPDGPDEEDGGDDQPDRGLRRRPGAIRSTDLEPYTGLRWVSTLFKAAAVFVFVALAAEFVAGLRMAGTAALPTLLGETAQIMVLAVVLWGGGDLVRLLVDIGHDLRAQRILMVRLLSRTPRRRSPDPVDEEAEELNIRPEPGSGPQSAA
ncbi:MAG: hypothetical protein ACOCVZ_08410 [Gemmatimonadota bacterium]